MLRPALLATALTLALLPAAHAQWKWRDAAGKVQYSDLPPPPGTADKDILQRPANAKQAVVVSAPGVPASAPVPPKPAASKPDAAKPDASTPEQQRKKAEEEKAARLKDEQEKQRLAEQRRDNCDRAQEALRTLQSGQRITRTNAQGERVFLDEGQVAAEIQRARGVMASDCGK